MRSHEPAGTGSAVRKGDRIRIPVPDREAGLASIVMGSGTPDAVAAILDAGGSIVVPPFDIQIGRCSVVQDPWATNSHSSITAKACSCGKRSVRVVIAVTPTCSAPTSRSQAEWAYRQVFSSNQERAAALAAWLEHYNNRRRHSALGGRPPISRLAPT